MAEVAAATCLEQVRLLEAKLAIVGGEVTFNATLASASVQSKAAPACPRAMRASFVVVPHAVHKVGSLMPDAEEASPEMPAAEVGSPAMPDSVVAVPPAVVKPAHHIRPSHPKHPPRRPVQPTTPPPPKLLGPRPPKLPPHPKARPKSGTGPRCYADLAARRRRDNNQTQGGGAPAHLAARKQTSKPRLAPTSKKKTNQTQMQRHHQQRLGRMWRRWSQRTWSSHMLSVSYQTNGRRMIHCLRLIW